MQSKIEIINAALSGIGEQSITDINENSARARTVKGIYDNCRREMLRLHPWSAAKSRIQLSPLASSAPAFGYKYKFQQPKDCMRVLSVGDCGYTIEGRFILSNQNEINLEYIFDNTQEESWDSLMDAAMCYLLASRLAKPTTGSSTEADRQWQLLQKVLEEAKAINAQEQPEDMLNFAPSSVIAARYN